MLGYDYSREGLYFVTSCVKDRAYVFGEVVKEEMQLNGYGRIAEEQWLWLERQYPYLVLHAFIIMPNHVHAILEIDQDNKAADTNIKSISALMGAYKTTTSKKIRQAGLADFAWHRSFHDHIIRHERAYQNILHYIQTNPSRWQTDTFHS
ncbi:hypothetical protein FVR03_20835 [Pontibacter qinzhouensis]|uniref:Transposase IS200-like domain-containing protein n=2 Tax=Pontibacter qinzhouensis TaxID=2603253 RepID=A0A5C8J0C7_9BACT|nr:hypothetical protein FVR03_20835 [Pontibacter qinzhouensis]